MQEDIAIAPINVLRQTSQNTDEVDKKNYIHLKIISGLKVEKYFPGKGKLSPKIRTFSERWGGELSGEAVDTGKTLLAQALRPKDIV